MNVFYFPMLWKFLNSSWRYDRTENVLENCFGAVFSQFSGQDRKYRVSVSQDLRVGRFSVRIGFHDRRTEKAAVWLSNMGTVQCSIAFPRFLPNSSGERCKKSNWHDRGNVRRGMDSGYLLPVHLSRKKIPLGVWQKDNRTTMNQTVDNTGVYRTRRGKKIFYSFHGSSILLSREARLSLFLRNDICM